MGGGGRGAFLNNISIPPFQASFVLLGFNALLMILRSFADFIHRCFQMLGNGSVSDGTSHVTLEGVLSAILQETTPATPSPSADHQGGAHSSSESFLKSAILECFTKAWSAHKCPLKVLILNLPYVANTFPYVVTFSRLEGIALTNF